MQEEKLDEIVLKKLNLPLKQKPQMKTWNEFLKRLKNPKRSVKIGLVGKYVELADAYKSIIESLLHAGSVNECKVQINLIHSETLTESNIVQKLSGMNGILVAPGFGHRGIEGKVIAVQYARENNIPFFGICLGMQCAVIEFARNVLGFADAHSTEMSHTTEHPVIDLMEEQKEITEKGGTMRLGAYACELVKGTRVHKVYKKNQIFERHRHRYEFNNNFGSQFQKAGMVASGINPEMNLVEIMEIPAHKWFVGVQFHPEYRSTVENPHPLFVDFIKAAIG
jgi:CTP synthase